GAAGARPEPAGLKYPLAPMPRPGSGPSLFERHPRTTLLLMLAVLLPLTDLLFTRLYAAFRPQFYRDRSAFRVSNAIYHHGFKPNVSVDLEYWGPLRAPYRINSLGFRDRWVREVPPLSARRRIVFIGDSFTEGIGIPYEQTFVGLVEEALAPRGIEVLNAGAASYTPIIDYRRVKHLVEEVGLRFDELIVFIDIGDIQDETTYALDTQGNVSFKQNRWLKEDRANWYRGKPPGLARFPLYQWLRKNTLVMSTGYEYLLLWSSRGPRRAAAWTLDDQTYREYGLEGLARARRHMDLLADFVAARGIRLTVAVYPWPDQILAGDRDSRQARFWSAWAEARGARFIDCFPSFFENPPEETVRREFIKGDIHWNQAGHRRVAEVVLAHLERRSGVEAEATGVPQ
ncbi:MAG TPA: hypothetical protein VJU18_01965, partial [Vicinamibacteria bacterium]|nr:hypothetical protein [Vicinamibacteria bacterium]